MQSLTKIEVRYAETDQMGVVHHSVYPIWFEVARTQFSQEMGFPYKKMEKMGLFLPVRELSIKYLEPVKYGDTVIIETKAVRLTPARIVFSYRVLLENHLMTIGETLHAWTNRELRPVNLKKVFPQVYEAALKSLET